jgi:hypothetical protein
MRIREQHAIRIQADGRGVGGDPLLDFFAKQLRSDR